MSGIMAIVQARMGSTRLPGKVLMEIGGKPMLARVMERAGQARKLDGIVVATTGNDEDDRIVSLCRDCSWECFRGSEADVLDRYYRAAVEYRAEHVVRITSDCPLIDPGLVDRVVEEFLAGQPGLDYASNFLPRRTFPRGLDTEIMTFRALERSWREDTNPAHREHVTQYILRHPELFRTHGVIHGTDLSHHRWTVDTIEDLDLVRAVFSHFRDLPFTWLEVLRFLESHPELAEINRHIRQKTL